MVHVVVVTYAQILIDITDMVFQVKDIGPFPSNSYPIIFPHSEFFFHTSTCNQSFLAVMGLHALFN